MTIHEANQILTDSKLNENFIIGSLIGFLEDKDLLDEYMEDFPKFASFMEKLIEDGNISDSDNNS